MFLFRRLIACKPDVFFTLLAASAEEARHSIAAVVKIISHPEELPSLDEFILTRRKEKRIAEQISEELLKHPVIQRLERDDIEALSHALYKIPKTAEKFAERFILGHHIVRSVDFSRHVGLLEQAAETIVAMTAGLQRAEGPTKLKELNDRLQYYEGEADKLILDHYKELYSGSQEPLTVIVLKDLFELLESAVDCCRDAGNAIYHTVLKNGR